MGITSVTSKGQVTIPKPVRQKLGIRGYYGFPPQEIARVFHHLLGLAHVTVEDRETLAQALARSEAGLDIADALHHASYRDCESMASF